MSEGFDGDFGGDFDTGADQGGENERPAEWLGDFADLDSEPDLPAEAGDFADLDAEPVVLGGTGNFADIDNEPDLPAEASDVADLDAEPVVLGGTGDFADLDREPGGLPDTISLEVDNATGQQVDTTGLEWSRLESVRGDQELDHGASDRMPAEFAADVVDAALPVNAQLAAAAGERGAGAQEQPAEAAAGAAPQSVDVSKYSVPDLRKEIAELERRRDELATADDCSAELAATEAQLHDLKHELLHRTGAGELSAKELRSELGQVEERLRSPILAGDPRDATYAFELKSALLRSSFALSDLQAERETVGKRLAEPVDYPRREVDMTWAKLLDAQIPEAKAALQEFVSAVNFHLSLLPPPPELQMLSDLLDAVPHSGDAKALTEWLTGENTITGEEISPIAGALGVAASGLDLIPRGGGDPPKGGGADPSPAGSSSRGDVAGGDVPEARTPELNARADAELGTPEAASPETGGLRPSALDAQTASPPTGYVRPDDARWGGADGRPEPLSAQEVGIRESAGASPRGADFQSASAQTERSGKTSIRADTGEMHAYRQTLSGHEIGLERPQGANNPGRADFISAIERPDGSVLVIATDVKTSTVGQFPQTAGGLKPSWELQVREAVSTGRLNLGDPGLEDRIRAAVDAGVEFRQLNVDFSKSDAPVIDAGTGRRL